MKLRWFQTYDNFTGYYSAESLQFWNKDTGYWMDVGSVRVPKNDEDNAMTDPNMVGGDLCA